MPHVACVCEAFASAGSGVFSAGLRDPPTPTSGSSTIVFLGKMFSSSPLDSLLSVKRAVERRRKSEFQERSEVGVGRIGGEGWVGEGD